MQKLLDSLPRASVEIRSTGVIDTTFLDKTVVFVRAAWSAQSKERELLLVEAINSPRAQSEALKVIVLDTDLLDRAQMDRLFETKQALNGCGEMLWIRNGCIVCSDCRGKKTIQVLVDLIKYICKD